MYCIKLKNLYIITFIFLICLQTFVIPVGSKFMLVSTIFMLISFLVYLVTNFKFFIKILKSFLLNKYTNLFFLFIIWVIFLSTILSLLGKTTFQISLSNIFLGLFFSVSFPLFFGFLFGKTFNISTAVKAIYISLLIIMLFGLVDFLAFFFNIEPLKDIFYFLVNQRQLANNVDGEAVKVIVNGIPRIQSFFVEPGLFSYFTALMLPFIYKFSSLHTNIFENKSIDKMFKKILPIVTWFDIIFSQSPIGIIFCSLVTLYYILTYKKITFKHLLYFVGTIFVILILLSLFFSQSTLGVKIFSRINTIIYLISDFNKFSLLEESLATRLILYFNCIIIAIEHPFFGVGWGHLGLDLSHQLPLSPLPLTYELIRGLSKVSNGTSYGLVISYRILAETGLFGFLLFYSFIMKIIFKLKLYLKNIKGEAYNIFKVFCSYLILFIVFSFYESLLYAPHYWVLIGLIIAITNKNKIMEFENNGCVNNINKL